MKTLLAGLSVGFLVLRRGMPKSTCESSNERCCDYGCRQGQAGCRRSLGHLDKRGQSPPKVATFHSGEKSKPKSKNASVKRSLEALTAWPVS